MNIKLALTSLAVSALIAAVRISYQLGIEEGKSQESVRIEAYLDKIHSLQIDLEKERNNIKTKVVNEYVDKIKTIVKKEKEYVYQAINDVPAQCNLSTGWIMLHNAAAEGSDIDSTITANGSPSGIEDNSALAAVVSNYSICRENAQQLISLQEFIIKMQIEASKLNVN